MQGRNVEESGSLINCWQEGGYSDFGQFGGFFKMKHKKTINHILKMKNHMFYDFIYVTFSKWQNYRGEKETSGCKGAEIVGGR